MTNTVTEAKGINLSAPQHVIPAEVDPLLSTILCWPRPHMSPAELNFRQWLGGEIRMRTAHDIRVLAQGCRYVAIPHADGKPSTTLFSCHVDTVDAPSEGNLVDLGEGATTHQRKKLTYDPNFGIIALEAGPGTCLGADDGVGVWLMLKMIEAKVPGGYIFHTGEERGGIGSYDVLAKNSDVLKLYEVAVAFDRGRDSDVITHQGGLRCASEKFALALAARLNEHKLDYRPCSGGSFTDTKVYRKVIAECTNIGVGYESQHGRSETQDYAHAVALKDAVCALDWLSLPVDRDPTEADPAPVYNNKAWGGSNNRDYYAGMGLFSNDQDDLTYPRRVAATPPTKALKTKTKATKAKLTAVGKPAGKQEDYTPTLSVFDELSRTSLKSIQDWCFSDSDDAGLAMAQLLVEIGELRGQVMVLRNMAGLTE